LVENGDDAVVLRRVPRPLVVSVDASVQGVHFDRAYVSLKDVGFRSHAAAVSDLAAMAAEPICSLSALAVPKGFSRRELAQLAAGQQLSATQHECAVVGGNLSRGTELSVTTTVIGSAARPAVRSGARPGHAIWLIGTVGLARAGLELLRAKKNAPRTSRAARAAALEAFRRPRALLAEGRRAGKRASALIDVSDGLLQDADQIARASGVRLSFDWTLLQRLPTAELSAVAAAFGVHPLQWALAGGEDYALLATAPAQHGPTGARLLGQVTRGTGVRLVGAPAWAKRLRGFDHLR
jgi:thiamine-monophosphate kinase